MTRLDLPNGQWIEVKDSLRVADDDRKFGYACDGINNEGRVSFNVVRHNVARAAVRIVKWSIKDEDGKDIPYPSAGPTAFKARTDRINELDLKTFEAIVKALDEFERERVEAEEKNDSETAGATV